MMKWIFGGIIVLSVVYSFAAGTVEEVSGAALGACSDAVSFLLVLLGSMCFWGGFLKIAERAGITASVSKLLSPVIRLLFPSLPEGSEAREAIAMNLTANLLGLGNAATPLGIAAMKALDKEIPHKKGTASHPMILFVLLNTASIQLLPTTLATMRLESGSAAPLDILPAILVTSALALTVALLSAQLCRRLSALRRVRQRA